MKRCLVALASAFSLVACMAKAPAVPADWKADCVGTMELRFPGDVDVAANTHHAESEREPDGTMRFLDGENADSAHFWFGGSAWVTHPLSDTEAAEFMAPIERYADKRWRALKALERKKAIADPANSPLLRMAFPQAVGWRADGRFEGTMRVGASYLSWLIQLPGSVEQANQENTRIFEMITRARPRSLFDIPRQGGVCLPYVFIPESDAFPSRSIAVAYRLKAHPDITIWLQDSRASVVNPVMKPEAYTAKGMTNLFWGSRYQSATKKLISRNDLPLAGYKSLNTFVELTREKRTIRSYEESQRALEKVQRGETVEEPLSAFSTDYGYLAVVRGDPDAKVDTPDLMFYVIRNAKNASDKGIEPMGKEEFLKLAQTMAASVKRRPVQEEAR